MRWIRKEQEDTRIKMRFLFFPKTINNETRWLENAIWEQKFIHDLWNYDKWEDSKWI
jgi:hypothetical protein